MKNVTLANYRKDKYYPKVVRAVATILSSKKFVAPIDVFKALELLSDEDLARWKKGEIPYLERVVKCKMSKAGRVLRILRFHAHDLNLGPSMSVYKNKKGVLRFSKTGDKNLEEAYSRHFVIIGKKETQEKFQREISCQ